MIYLLVGFNIIAWVWAAAMKFNDLKHLNCDIKKIWEELKGIRAEQVEQGKQISALESWRETQE